MTRPTPPPKPPERSIAPPQVALLRRLGQTDATLIVMGGIIGSGIFVTPSVVATRVPDARLIVAAWVLGGALTLVGALIFAELAQRRPAGGGLYGYLRDAYHPLVGFMYGWTALLVAQSGGIAAAAITFGAYLSPLLPAGVSARDCGLAAIVILTVINCLGVRQGSNAQNGLMLVKIAAIALFVGIAFVVVGRLPDAATSNSAEPLAGSGLLGALAAAMIPVFFAYSGFQTASFIDGEMRDARLSLPRALVAGVGAVVVLYIAVVLADVRVLGSAGLAATATPVPDMMRIAFGPLAQRIVAVTIAISLFGFLSNQILASPRIYYAMAKDRLFFRKLAWVHPTTRVPVPAIVLQGIVAIVIALSGRYDKILNYVTVISLLFLSLAAGALMIFRKRATGNPSEGVRVPGHPVTTMVFIAVNLTVVVNTSFAFPLDTAAGFGLLLAAVPVFFLLRRWERRR